LRVSALRSRYGFHGWSGTLAVASQSRQKSIVVFRAVNASSRLAGTFASPQDRTTYADWP